MSTIEKAAAKLAAKRKAQEGSDLSGTQPATLRGAERRVAEQPAQSALKSTFRIDLDAAPALADSVFGSVAAGSDSATRFQRKDPSARRVGFHVPAVPTGAAEIDLKALEADGFITPDGAGSIQGQEFRKIKRQLLNRIDRQRQLLKASEDSGAALPENSSVIPPNLVMVTSALAGEGKTRVTTNLAMSLAAEVDHSVLLIDGDIAKSDLTRNFDLIGRTGLGEVLNDPNRIGEAMLATNVPRLTLIPAGQYQENLDELFASDLMEAFAFGLAKANPDHIVLFDSPPLLVTTEAAVLSQYMSEVLLVIEANRTPNEAVAQALSELSDLDNVSLILNKVRGTSRFSQGYGYGYGYGYGKDKPSDSAATAEMDIVNTGTPS